MKTSRPSCKLSKQTLAETLAKALNLLNNLHASAGLDGDGFSVRDENDYYEIVSVLDANPQVRADFANNGTLDARDLI